MGLYHVIYKRKTKRKTFSTRTLPSSFVNKVEQRKHFKMRIYTNYCSALITHRTLLLCSNEWIFLCSIETLTKLTIREKNINLLLTKAILRIRLFEVILNLNKFVNNKIFFFFQNLKNQIMTTNLWVEQVRKYYMNHQVQDE